MKIVTVKAKKVCYACLKPVSAKSTAVVVKIDGKKLNFHKFPTCKAILQDELSKADSVTFFRRATA